MSNGPVTIIAERIISPIKEFIKDSRAVGIVLICCTALSLILSNTAWAVPYIHVWEHEFDSSIAGLHLPHSFLHIINDGLMALFFLLVGMEIKRELLVGELKTIKKSLLPIVAAAGGMVAPAVIYMLWCGGTQWTNGWGIPMATDIAFSLGILSLLGRRAPLSLRIFLTALAIIDDLGGILTIAIFYAGDINWNYLLTGAGVMVVLTTMNLLKVNQKIFYYVPGIILWYVFFNSGVHATIAGVLLAFTIPLHRIDKLIHHLHDPVNFIILPLFALANTAIALPDSFGFIFSSMVHHGIFFGLVVGKPVGIFVFSMVAVRLKLAELPYGMGWKQLLGTGMIAGIGFTMSIFMATLAFNEPGIQLVAKVAIITASTVAGLLGFVYLKRLRKTEILKERERRLLKT